MAAKREECSSAAGTPETVLEPNGDSRDEEVPTEMMSETGMHVGSDHAQPRRLAKRIVPVKPVILQDF